MPTKEATQVQPPAHQLHTVAAGHQNADGVSATTTPDPIRLALQRASSRWHRWMIVFALNWPGMVLVLLAVLSSKIGRYFPSGMEPTLRLHSTLFMMTGMLVTPIAMKLSEEHGKAAILRYISIVGAAGLLIAASSTNYTVMVIGWAVAGIYVAAGAVALFAMRECFPHNRFPLVVIGILITIGCSVIVSVSLWPAALDQFGWRATLLIGTALAFSAVGLLSIVPNEAPRKLRLTDLHVLARAADAIGPLMLNFALMYGGDFGWTSPPVVGAVLGGVAVIATHLVRARRHRHAENRPR